jgi:hypothetical protein
VRRWLARWLGVLRHRRAADPEAILELHRTLAAIRFKPRASLGPEVVARARRGEAPPPLRRRLGGPLAWGGAAVGFIVVLASLLVLGPGTGSPARRLDRCCFDLDGAGPADDGLVIVVGSGDRVRRAFVYEDAHGNRRFTAGDVVRLAPGTGARPGGPLPPSLVTLDRCCWDLDAEGPEDDGVMTVSAPPDRVLLAAIYERRHGAGPAGQDGRYLRYVIR